MLPNNYKEFLEFLESQGLSGQTNEQIYDFLIAQGYEEALNDMWKEYFTVNKDRTGHIQDNLFIFSNNGFPVNIIINAVEEPVLLVVDDAQTPADALSSVYTQTSNYTTSSGTISSAVPTYRVNGSVEASTFNLSLGDTVQVSILVTDSFSNTRTFTTNTIVVVASPVPVNTGAPVLS